MKEFEREKLRRELDEDLAGFSAGEETEGWRGGVAEKYSDGGGGSGG